MTRVPESTQRSMKDGCEKELFELELKAKKFNKVNNCWKTA